MTEADFITDEVSIVKALNKTHFVFYFPFSTYFLHFVNYFFIIGATLYVVTLTVLLLMTLRELRA